MSDGIYTLANDTVYDQLVALLNSLEQNAGNLPVCVIAYDSRIERVKAEVERRDGVFLLDDPAIFKTWEDFSVEVWQTHPTALATWRDEGIPNQVYRLHSNRRYAAFDERSPFDRFIYLDADTVVFQPLDFVFEQLDTADFVTYDFQFKDPTHIFSLNSQGGTDVFGQAQLAQIFCAGMYASKKGFFPAAQLSYLVEQLAAGDAAVLYMGAPNQSVLNYMVLKTGLDVCNLALALPSGTATGNAVTSPHFEASDHILYDKGSRLTYLHYIGVSAKVFRGLCAGENIDFPYRDIFLHYRYLHQPGQRPQLRGKPHYYKQGPTLKQRVFRKLGLARAGS
ncbi:MAG: sugar transferase [Leptolyngbya sp. SIO4C1]|nr:sugar transferase [Leptolyngbya sp. SIO4C1]